MDDPHDPFTNYRPDMGQQPQNDREDEEWQGSWWILPVIASGAFIWIALFIWVIR